MSRLPLVDPDTNPELFADVQKQMGGKPNMTKAMASSPAVLRGYLDLSRTLRSTLNAKTREVIALAIAQSNRCEYCLSAHSYGAEHRLHLSADEIAQARKGSSSDARTNAAVTFALAVNEKRGATEEDVSAARAAGLTDKEIAEVVANVALSVYTNFFNNTNDTDVDFPLVTP
ncbi:carboxymuconolactone decarboxylase family protein [Micromonospora sp. NPDC094482]|uniref:carboxymuconolactone decarboxylase family protein n=1 Tax=unclassified Micromonospora TaxID=2617518 RepID=UPI00332A1BE3